MIKLIKWIFWRIIYCFYRPKNFASSLKKIGRLKFNSPWYKFKPSIYHNDNMKEWTIYLKDERSHTITRQTLNNVHIMISDKTGEVVGFDIWDEELERIEKEYLNRSN